MGNYTFSTSSAEKMVLISGNMEVALSGHDFKRYVAYICYYA